MFINGSGAATSNNALGINGMLSTHMLGGILGNNGSLGVGIGDSGGPGGDGEQPDLSAAFAADLSHLFGPDFVFGDMAGAGAQGNGDKGSDKPARF